LRSSKQITRAHIVILRTNGRQGKNFFLSPEGPITMKQRYTSEGFNASSLCRLPCKVNWKLARN
jgi:hypothetical protein